MKYIAQVSNELRNGILFGSLIMMTCCVCLFYCVLCLSRKWVVVTGVVVVVSIPFIWSPVQITINLLQNTRDIVTGVRCTTCVRQLTFWITLAVSRHLAEPTFCMQSKANHYVILGTCLNKDNNVCKGFSRQQHAGSQELFQLIAFNQFSGFKNCVVLYNEMHSQKSLWQMESLVSHVVQK